MTALEPGSAIFFLQLAILSIAARAGGEWASRLRLPVVIGEVMVGIILGPTVLRHLFPNLQAELFPSSGPIAIALGAVATLGIALFLLSAGLEVDLKMAKSQLRSSLPISLAGLATPCLLGFIPAYFWPELLGCHPDSNRLVFALFVGAAMSITALAMTARTLFDLNLYKTHFAMAPAACGYPLCCSRNSDTIFDSFYSRIFLC